MNRGSKGKGGSSSSREAEWKPLSLTSRNLTSLLNNLGTSKLSVEQLFNHPCQTRDQSGLHALVLFFKWRPLYAEKNSWNASQSSGSVGREGEISDSSHRNLSNRLMVSNHFATGFAPTQALLGVIMNISRSKQVHLKMPYELSNLQRFLVPLEPTLRSAVINDSAFVRSAHNKTVAGAESESGNTEEFWHYITYSLDPSGRMNVCAVENFGGEVSVLGAPDHDEDWFSLTEDPIIDKIQLFRSNGIPFKLFGVYLDHKSSKRDRELDTGSEESRQDDRRKRRKLSSKEVRIRKHDYTQFLVEMAKVLSSQGTLKRSITRALSSEVEEGSMGVPSENDRGVSDDEDDVAQSDDEGLTDRHSNDYLSESGGHENGSGPSVGNGRRSSPDTERNGAADSQSEDSHSDEDDDRDRDGEVDEDDDDDDGSRNDGDLSSAPDN